MLGKKFCPKCRSEDIAMVAGGITGSWMCKKCGFSGSVFPEREIVVLESGINKKAKKGGKKK